MIAASPEKISNYRARGWWGDQTLYDHFRANAEECPDRLALVDAPNRSELIDTEARRLTFSEVSSNIDRLAAVLVQLGIGKDDIVLVQLPNIVEFAVLYLACSRLGVIVSPVPMQYRQHELEAIVVKIQPKMLISVTRFKGEDFLAHWRSTLDVVADRLRAIPQVLVLSAAGEGVHSLNALMATVNTELLVDYLVRTEVSADDILTICWTSGTEGMPKGVPRSHNHWLAIGLGTYDSTNLGGREAVLLNPFPLVNMGAIGGLFLSWLYSGGTLVLHHPVDLAVFLQQIATERVTFTLAPPALLNRLLKDEQLLDEADISSLKAIGSGSAPLDAWMVAGYQQCFGIEIVNYFGSNEGVSLVCGPREVADPTLRARLFPRFGVAGLSWHNRVANFTETRLVAPDSDGVITEVGTVGELQLRGATLFEGYYGAPEQTAAAFTDDGFYHTGDLFEIAIEGDGRFYRFVGRSKDLIIRGGMNIAPAELDNLISAHDDLVEAAVAGYPCNVMGERIAVFAVLKPGAELTLDSIVAWLKGHHLASFKLPEKLVIVDVLPRNPLGKVIRYQLPELIADP